MNHDDRVLISLEHFEAEIQLYLYVGTDVDARRGRYLALEALSNRSHESTIQILSEAGTDLDEEKGFCEEAQRASLVENLESVIEMTLDPKAWSDAQQTAGCRVSLSVSAECYKELISTMQWGG